MAVNPSLVAFGQAKPPFQIEIIFDRFILLLAHEQAGKKAEHHRGHVMANRVLCALEVIDQCLVLLPAIGAALLTRLQGRGYLLDVLDVLPD